MATFYLPLALVLLLSCPAPAQWLSFICANAKTSPSPPSNTSASVASSDAKKATEWLSKEDLVLEASVEGSSHSPGGSGTVQPGTLAPAKAAGAGGRGGSQFKPLKQWKCGEYQETSIKRAKCNILCVAEPSHRHHPLSGGRLHKWPQGSLQARRQKLEPSAGSEEQEVHMLS